MDAKHNISTDHHGRLMKLETTVNDQLIPDVKDHDARLRVVERWIAIGTGALGVIAFLIEHFGKH